MDLAIKDKIAIVTGAGSGIGAAITRALAAEGAKVAVVDLDGHAADDLARSIDGLAIRADVADDDAPAEIVRRTRAAFGTVHVLVNNVGITAADWLEQINDADFDKTVSVNMRSHLRCTQAVIPLMKRQRWGRLIYISSGSGLKASAGMALYSASKYFLRGLAVSAGLELGQHGITANTVCPSDVYPGGDEPARSWKDEKLLAVSLQKEGVESFEALMAKRIAANPMRRACTVEDVAAVVAFLASERAGFINAQTIGVNGGAIPT